MCWSRHGIIIREGWNKLLFWWDLTVHVFAMGLNSKFYLSLLQESSNASVDRLFEHFHFFKVGIFILSDAILVHIRPFLNVQIV